MSSLYHRNKPVREFDLNQTMYTTITHMNQDNLNLDAIGFLGKNINYKTLLQNVDRLADAYSKIGIKEGDVIAIGTINMPIVQENLLALSKLGATSKWIDLRIKGKDLIKNINESHCKTMVIFDGITSNILEIIDETDLSRVFVASPKDYLNPFIQILANLKDKKEGKLISLPDDKRFSKYTDFLKSGNINSNIKPAKFEKDRPSLIVQSSGSTGKAKSIIHTEYNFNSAMQKEAYTDLPFSKGKTMYVAIPPFIIYGLNNSIYASLSFSMKAEMTPYVSETTIYDDLGKYHFAAGAPLHYRYLYNKILELQNRVAELEHENSLSAKKELRRYLKELSNIYKKLSTAEAFVSGGDKIVAQELLSMEQLFEVPIINGYGNNELTGAAAISPVYANKPDSVGIPLKGISVATFDPETNEKLDIGVEGEICFQSDNVFVGYLNNEEETKKIKQTHKDGSQWIHTGDLGIVDSDGYIFITGRSKRLIKKEAFKISPDTIENVIMNVKGVKDCVVVGVPDVNHDESSVPMAFIELQPEFDGNFEDFKQIIIQTCQEELPDYEIPEYIANAKIPYKNNKRAFKELEQQGEEYVKSIKQGSQYTMKKVYK